MSNSKTTERALLIKWETALRNAQEQPEIATQIAKFGFGAEKIAEGQALYDNTLSVWNTNKQEDLETTEASNLFKAKKKALDTLYKSHRSKAKALFKTEPESLVLLGVVGTMPSAYTSRLDKVKQFYTQLSLPANATIKTQLMTYDISEEELGNAEALISEMETARMEYLREEGESQDATKLKDEAMAGLEDWMRKFYAMASIALKGRQQLLEALGLFRKS